MWYVYVFRINAKMWGENTSRVILSDQILQGDFGLYALSSVTILRTMTVFPCRIWLYRNATRRFTIITMRDPLERYCVYILLCSDGTYYVGMTNDVEKRLMEHQEGLMGSQSYTFKRRPVKLVFKHGFREVNDAITWERQIKGWGRKKKEALIQERFDVLPALAKKKFERP